MFVISGMAVTTCFKNMPMLNITPEKATPAIVNEKIVIIIFS